MSKEQNNNSKKNEELERVTKSLTYAVRFTFGKIESQALIQSVLQKQAESA